MESEKFESRFIALNETYKKELLDLLQLSSEEDFFNKYFSKEQQYQFILPEASSEYELEEEMTLLAARNRKTNTFIGLGWYGTIIPSIIKESILQNPAWYSLPRYPKVEHSQGLLEVLFHFQTLLQEFTSCKYVDYSYSNHIQAIHQVIQLMKEHSSCKKFFVDESVFPYLKSSIRALAKLLAIEIIEASYKEITLDETYFGVFIQYPNAKGSIEDYTSFIEEAHSYKIQVATYADLLSLLYIKSPKEFGADFVLGSTQRLGLPMAFGGVSPSFIASDHKIENTFQVLSDKKNNKEYTYTGLYNIEQAFLAVAVSLFAIYHGKDNLIAIAKDIHSTTALVADEMEVMGYQVIEKNFFDTLHIALPNHLSKEELEMFCEMRDIDCYFVNDKVVQITFDETSTEYKVHEMLAAFSMAMKLTKVFMIDDLPAKSIIPSSFLREENFLEQDIFKAYHSELSLSRYIHHLTTKNKSPLNSIVLQSDAATLPSITAWNTIFHTGFMEIHPFTPKMQIQGFGEMLSELSELVKQVTGYDRLSYQNYSISAADEMALRVVDTYNRVNGVVDKKTIILFNNSTFARNYHAYTYNELPATSLGLIDYEKAKDYLKNIADNVALVVLDIYDESDEYSNFIVYLKMLDIQIYLRNVNTHPYFSPSNLGIDFSYYNFKSSFDFPTLASPSSEGLLCVKNHLAPYLSSMGGDKPETSNPIVGNLYLLPYVYTYFKLMSKEGLLNRNQVQSLKNQALYTSLKNILNESDYKVSINRISNEISINGLSTQAEKKLSHFNNQLASKGFYPLKENKGVYSIAVPVNEEWNNVKAFIAFWEEVLI